MKIQAHFPDIAKTKTHTLEFMFATSTKLSNTATRLSRVLVVFSTLLIANVVFAQDNSNQSTDSSTTSEDIAQLEQKFHQIQEEFRQAALDVQKTGVKYLNTPTIDDAETYADEFEAKIVAGNKILKRWIPVGMKLFELKTENGGKVDDNLATFVHKYMMKSFDDCQYEKTYQLAKKLVENNPENDVAKFYLVRSSLLTNRFGKETEENLLAFQQLLQGEVTISDAETMIVNNLYLIDELFKAELAIRKKDADADDLPRVKFETTKGDFVVELFENEAPETVANFINLVEAKHYDGLIFDTVIDKTAVETGRIDGDFHRRDVGYTIYDEFEKPNARKSFTGSLIMMSNKPNSAATRFFITIVPIPAINGKQTVFGRVISGMENVNAINKTFTLEEKKQIPIEDAKFDKIISAKVLRKREHKYEPRKFVPE